MTRPLAVAVALACALTVYFITPVWAQRGPPCYERESLVDTLARRFGERMTAAGVDARGSLVQVFAAPSGSWTIAVSLPNGPTCILSSGEGWQSVDPSPAAGETPS